MVRSLGLPEEAGVGIEPFLRAIQEQANRERSSDRDPSDQGGSDRMDTD